MLLRHAEMYAYFAVVIKIQKSHSKSHLSLNFHLNW